MPITGIALVFAAMPSLKECYRGYKKSREQDASELEKA